MATSGLQLAIKFQFANYFMFLESLKTDPYTHDQFEEVLASSSDTRPIECLAENPHLPSELLEQLAKRKEKRILAGVALNPNLPLETLVEFGSSKSREVRVNAITNPKFPDDVLEQMVADKVDNLVATGIACRARWYKQVPSVPVMEKFFMSTRTQDICIVLRELKTTLQQEYLVYLGSHLEGKPSTVRDAFACMWYAHPQDLIRLATTVSNTYTLQQLCENPMLPTEALEYIIDHHNQPNLLKRIAEMTVNPDILQRIYNSTSNKDVREIVRVNEHFLR